MTAKIAVSDLEGLVAKALEAAESAPVTAMIMAETIVRAEAEGNTICGLHYVPALC